MNYTKIYMMKNLCKTIFQLSFVLHIVTNLACENRQDLLLAKEYQSKLHRFSFRFGEQWNIRKNVPEPGVEVILVNTDSLRGNVSTITFAVLFDVETANLSSQKVLSTTNSRLLTKNIWKLPTVSFITIHEEGKTRLGNQQAYQVKMTIEFTNGKERIRHMFFTFSDGYFYNVSISADPKNYTAIMKTAKGVLKSFRLL